MTSATLRQTQPRPLRSLTPRSLLISPPSRRYVSSSSFSSSSKTTPLQVLRLLFRRYPFSLTVAFATILISSAGILYSTYAYNTHVIAQFAAYPEPVAVKLRRALFYSSIEVSAKDAMRYFREALVLCMQHGMSPMSDEVMGIRLRMAAFLEEQQHYGKAAELLEMVRGEALRWLEEERWDGVEGNLEANARPRKERTRVLGKLVGICMKLGELYAGEYVQEREMAEERLVEAVEIVLKERKRRADEGVREADEGSWMSDTEIIAALEALAANYEGKSNFYLASPLYLTALSISPSPPDCHTMILMNNLSASLSQQSGGSSSAGSRGASLAEAFAPPNTPPASRSQLITSARQWAEKALEIAAHIRPPLRTSECDDGCAVATYNLGEFAEMEGNIREARKRYDEAASLSKAIGYREGIEAAREAMKRIDKQ